MFASVLPVVVSLAMAGCAERPSSSVTLTVSAAADLLLAFGEIGEQYERQTGSQVVFNFGSTGQLAQQIERGAPVDLFAAANLQSIRDLEDKGRVVPGTKRLYARGRLVLWTRAEGGLTVERLEELTGPEIGRIAIANPEHAPYGMAAKEAMQSAGVWEPVQDKLVFGGNAAQPLHYAQRGDVEVGIVPLSLSIHGDGRWTLIPEKLHHPIDQVLAVIDGTKHEREARQFADFIEGPQGRAIMEKYGFVLPEREGR